MGSSQKLDNFSVSRADVDEYLKKNYLNPLSRSWDMVILFSATESYNISAIHSQTTEERKHP